MGQAGQWKQPRLGAPGKGHRDRNCRHASPQMTARFDADCMAFITSEAARRGTTCAQVIRDAVLAARQAAQAVKP